MKTSSGRAPFPYLICRDLPDGRHLDVMPLTFGRGRVLLSADNRHEGMLDGW